MFKSGSFFGINHKIWEVQLEKLDDSGTVFNVELSLTRRCDHAGFRFLVELGDYYCNMQIYDSRHWDYSAKTWA